MRRLPARAEHGLAGQLVVDPPFRGEEELDRLGGGGEPGLDPLAGAGQLGGSLAAVFVGLAEQPLETGSSGTGPPYAGLANWLVFMPHSAQTTLPPVCGVGYDPQRSLNAATRNSPRPLSA